MIKRSAEPKSSDLGRNLRRRIEALERSPIFAPPPDPEHEALMRAFLRLPLQELEFCEELLVDREQGKERPVTEREVAYFQALDEALGEERQLAGLPPLRKPKRRVRAE